MTVLMLTLAALVLGYAVGWLDHRREHKPESTSLWWSGWEAGRDFGLAARHVGQGRNRPGEEGAEQ